MDIAWVFYTRRGWSLSLLVVGLKLLPLDITTYKDRLTNQAPSPNSLTRDTETRINPRSHTPQSAGLCCKGLPERPPRPITVLN